MLTSVKESWIQALRSGKFKQGKHMLYNVEKDSYCCLGVLCKVENLETKSLFNDNRIKFFYKNIDFGSFGQLPFDYANYIKLLPAIQEKLINLNDKDNKSFEEIADYIEQNL